MNKAQLIAALEASHVSYQKLEAEAASLRADVARLREHAAAGRYVRPHVSDAAIVAHDNYARALLKAREFAMRTGTTVRVGTQ